jgi:hypothetical protein
VRETAQFYPRLFLIRQPKVIYIQITSLERERAVTNIVKYMDQDNIWAFFVVAYEQSVDAPEPASLLLLGAGLLASGALSWRRRGPGFRSALFRRLLGLSQSEARLPSRQSRQGHS